MSVIDAIIAKKLCGGGGGSVPKPLTYDYMPEGYPKKTTGIVTVMEEQELAFGFVSDGGIELYMAQLTNVLEIVAGQTYTVNWDGTEYECVGSAIQKSLVLGNLSIMNAGSDTGEPFLYLYNTSESRSQFVTTDTAASHTISVKRTEEIVTPMAEEFLPAAALITYNLSTDTYSCVLTNDELHARLLDGKQIVLYKTDSNEYFYLTKWAKISSGRIDLAFEGDVYSVSLKTDGTIGKKPLS